MDCGKLHVEVILSDQGGRYIDPIYNDNWVKDNICQSSLLGK